MAGQKQPRTSRKRRRGGQVIHVSFGPGGGRLQGAAPAEAVARENLPHPREPITDTFTRGEVARLIGVSPRRLDTWVRSGVVTPSARKAGRRVYTFPDLIALRAAQALIAADLGLRHVTKAVRALRKTLPRLARPLLEVRVVSDGKKLVVHTADGAFEPTTGQMVLDFEVKDLRDDVVRVLRPTAGRERTKNAYDIYLRASQLDEDPATMGAAIELYRRAIELDPWLAIAHTNLGNIYFRRQEAEEAERCYGKALEIDGRQPEAQYNLGYVLLERGLAEHAVPLFLGAIEADPKFSDAYFNLAMALEQTGEVERARQYWKSYIELEPRGTWTEIAKRHL